MASRDIARSLLFACSVAACSSGQFVTHDVRGRTFLWRRFERKNGIGHVVQVDCWAQDGSPRETFGFMIGVDGNVVREFSGARECSHVRTLPVHVACLCRRADPGERKRALLMAAVSALTEHLPSRAQDDQEPIEVMVRVPPSGWRLISAMECTHVTEPPASGEISPPQVPVRVWFDDGTVVDLDLANVAWRTRRERPTADAGVENAEAARRAEAEEARRTREDEVENSAPASSVPCAQNVVEPKKMEPCSWCGLQCRSKKNGAAVRCKGCCVTAKRIQDAVEKQGLTYVTDIVRQAIRDRNGKRRFWHEPTEDGWEGKLIPNWLSPHGPFGEPAKDHVATTSAVEMPPPPPREQASLRGRAEAHTPLQQMAHTPGEHAPGEHAPGENAPGERAPGERAPGENAPGENAPGENAPGENAPGENAPGEHAPGEHAPGEHAPGEHAPGEPTYAQDNSGSLAPDDARPAKRAKAPPMCPACGKTTDLGHMQSQYRCRDRCLTAFSRIKALVSKRTPLGQTFSGSNKRRYGAMLNQSISERLQKTPEFFESETWTSPLTENREKIESLIGMDLEKWLSACPKVQDRGGHV